jgi:hypothetical protein
MKRIIELLQRRIKTSKPKFLIAVLMVNFSILSVHGQPSITGKLLDQKNNQAVPYANVALYKMPDSLLVNGAMSDTSGQFVIKPVANGNYRMIITQLGYQPVSETVEIADDRSFDSGILFLTENFIRLDEAVVIGERIKAKAENGKTSFYITKKMVDASNTGTDILRLIPGVQIDLMNNIALEGSQNILILVDGKERDRNFVSQIHPKQIDKIEIMSAPPSKYDASVTGVINIILKKEMGTGFSGHIYTEIPTSASEIFIAPGYGFNYGFKKLNLFTSYNGEMSYFDITENLYRTFTGSSVLNEITSEQVVRQKNWSHRFHYGFDYYLNTRNQVNFYAFFNPYSWEHDGMVQLQSSGIENNNRQSQKEDTDINTGTFYSLYFKHLFNDEGSEITFDVSNYNLKAENTTTYISEGSDKSHGTIVNSVKPRQNDVSMKIDYNSSSAKKLSFGTGVKVKFQLMNDLESNDFNYSENVFAVYGAVGYKNSKYDLNMGLRLENSLSDLENEFRNSDLSLLPYLGFNIQLQTNQSIQLSAVRSVFRPKIYQLNPYLSVSDPYTVQKGNPMLKPEFRNSVFGEYSIRLKNNFISTRLFYNNTTDAINNLTFVNDTATFETSVYNLGKVQQFGLQFTGALKLGRLITFNPYFRLFAQHTSPNEFARQYAINEKRQMVFESGFSNILSLKRDFDISFIFQYATPKNNIQDNWYCGALYFLSFEKTLFKNFKAGIVSGLPLKKSFVYTGSEISAPDFYSHNEGVITLADVSAWFKLSYQFNSGNKREKINREKEVIDNLPKKGF